MVPDSLFTTNRFAGRNALGDHHASKDQFYLLDWTDVVVKDFVAMGPVLDIGGGGEGIVGRLKGAQVVAIDKSRRELAEAPPGPLKVVMDATALQFLDGAFREVTAFYALMYIPSADHGTVLREAHRVLAPGGSFHIWGAVLPTRPETTKEYVVAQVRVRLPEETIEVGYGARWPAQRLDAAYYARLGEACGFSIRERSEWGNAFYLRIERATGPTEEEYR
jgi:SAM-dependent methyltransferase